MLKKLDKLVLKAFIGPFILVLLIVIFIFLLRLVLFYFADLFGKDLGTWVYAQLFFYFSLITFPLAVPLAMLISSLMTFGRLGENFELTAIKSAGISILRVFRPIIILSSFLVIFMYWFGNVALPWANLKGWSLLYDIKTTKSTLNIKEGQFYTDLPGYSIKVTEKFPDNKTLKNIIIYDHTQSDGNRHVTIADSAEMYTINNKSYLVFELFNGKDYLDDADRGKGFDKSDYAVHEFKRSKVVMSLDAFDMKKTSETQFSGYEMMKQNDQLALDADSLKKGLLASQRGFIKSSKAFYLLFNKEVNNDSSRKFYPWAEKEFKTKYKNWLEDFKTTNSLLDQEANNIISLTQTNSLVYNNYALGWRKTLIEWHRKYTNAISLIIMLLIGAPLGSIIKKGGFGVPIVVAVSFFILLYVLNTQGEKMAREGKIFVWAGSWLANFILGLIGIYFTRISIKDSRMFEWEAYKIRWENLIQRIKNKYVRQ
jgi:lipopolysaccharide export system permease protein